jgi:dynein heavy chain
MIHTLAPQAAEADVLRSMFEKYAVPCIDWVLEGVDGDDLVSG